TAELRARPPPIQANPTRLGGGVGSRGNIPSGWHDRGSRPHDKTRAMERKVFQAERHFQTTGGLHVTDITEEVAEIVRESGITDGICCVYSPHTTCCVRVNEYERGMFEDFTALLRRLIPPETYYAHDDWDRRTENICPEDMESGNGHAHCMSMILGSAGESIPVGDGELCMGQWQRVLFIELDRSRPRRWFCRVFGS